MWAHSGRELFYVSSQQELIAVEVRSSDTFFDYGPARPLFSTQAFTGFARHQTFDVAPDDQRFVMIRRDGGDGQDDLELIVVENFFEELKAKVGRE